MLSTSPGTTKPFDPEILVSTSIPRSADADTLIYDGHGDGGSMNASTTLCRRYALKTVAPGFFVEMEKIVAFNGESATRPKLLAFDFSAEAIRKNNVRFFEIKDEKFAVLTAFCGADFDELAHRMLLRFIREMVNHLRAAEAVDR